MDKFLKFNYWYIFGQILPTNISVKKFINQIKKKTKK